MGRGSHSIPIDVRELAYRQDQFDLLKGRRARYKARYDELKQEIASACEQVRLNEVRSPYINPESLARSVGKIEQLSTELIAVCKALYDCEEHLVDMGQLTWKETTRGYDLYEARRIAEHVRRVREGASDGEHDRGHGNVATPTDEEGPQPEGPGGLVDPAR